MSRKQTRRESTWSEVRSYLTKCGVTLMSAGLDEAPWAYKDIEKVMAAQAELVRPVAKFSPRIVRMAPEGEKPED